MDADKKYKILYEKLKALGIEDEEVINSLIENIDEFANLIIDLYLDQPIK